MVILQINCRRPDMPAAERDARCTADIAAPVVDMRGLKWKVWIDEPEAQLSGGIYQFEARADAETYLAGPVVTRMKGNPALTEQSFRIFDIRERVSTLTRAPLG